MSTSYILLASLPKIKAGLACNVAPTESSIDKNLPKLVASLTCGLTFSSVDISLPILEVSLISGYSHSTVNIDLPLLECNLESLYSHSSVSVTLPLIQGSLACMLTFSSVNVNLPKIQASFTGVSNSFSSVSVTLPLLQAVLTAANNTFSTVDILLPKIVVELISDGGGVYKCLVLNNETALTNWEFENTMDSIIEWDGDIYLASASGLFLLGGADDNGVDIDATIQTGLADGGIPNFKQAMGHYISYRSDGTIRLQFIADDEDDVTVHDLRTTANKIKTRWGMTEKGSRGRFLGAKISNVSGADFRIKSLDILAKLLHRKQTNG